MKNITLYPITALFVFIITIHTTSTCYAIDNIALKYSTYLGSRTDFDHIDIAVDAQNNLYIAGRANDTSTMPIFVGGYGDPNYVFSQSFVLKYSASNELVYSAFLQDAEITAIAVDTTGRVYLTGTHQGTGNSPYCNEWGFFVARLSADGSNLNFCENFASNYGGNPPQDIAIDQAGDVYITGSYAGTHIPTTSGVIQTTPAGMDDAYVIKFSSDGSQILTAYF